MATSGTLDSSSYSGRYIRYSWSCANQGGGTVKVSWTLKATGGSSSWYATGPTKLSVNGSSVYSKSRYNMYTGQLDSGSFTKSYTGSSTTFKVVLSTAIYTASVSEKSKTFTLPTIWKQTYSLNGASGTAPSATYAYNGGSVTLPAAPTWSGYTFKGWNSSSSGANTMRAAKSSITPTQNTTYYAIWSKNALVPFTYNANGGSGTVPTHGNVNYGSSFTTGSGSGLSKTGYYLSHWNTASDGSGTTYSKSTSYTLNWTSTKVLYAIWKPYVLSVNYYSNNATSGTLNGTAISGLSADVEKLVMTLQYNYGVTRTDFFWNYTSSANDLYLKKDYYTGTGYYTNADGSVGELSQSDYNSTTQAMATKFGKNLATGNVSISIYPKWKQNVLTVNYYANGGKKSDGTTPSSTTIAGSSTYSSMSTDSNGLLNYTPSSGAGLPLTRTGYTPSGNWNTKADGSGYSISETFGGTGQELAAKLGKSLKDGDATVSVYAQWTPQTNTVTFDPVGGTTSKTQITVTYDKTTGNVQTSNIPTKAGFVFLGWGTTSDPATAKLIWDYEGNCMFDKTYWSGAGKWTSLQDLKVYALWQDENTINKFYFFNSGEFFARELVEFDRDEDPFQLVQQ